MSDQFGSEENRKLLQNIIATHFQTKTGFVLTNEEYYLINSVIDKILEKMGPNVSLSVANKKVIELTHDIINKKRIEKIETVKPPTPSLPKISAKEKIEEITESFANVIQTIEIAVDSRLRNTENFPNPNNYRYELPTELHNITRIELINAEIPRSDYNINSSNNEILFKENLAQTTFTQATITPGTYTISQLATALETAMDTASSTGAVFSLDITTLALQNKVVLSSDIGGSADLFTVSLDSTLFPVLGFTSELSGSSSYTAPNRYNLSLDTYIVMKINGLPGTMRSTNSYLDGSFAKISIGNSGDVKFFSTYSDYQAILNIQPPVKSMAYLDISFYNFNGLHNFNGLNHSFTLRVSYVNSTRQ